MDTQDRASAARTVHQRRAALRALEDPRQLARAARIVRLAIERGRLTVEDVAPGGPSLLDSAIASDDAKVAS